MGAYTVSGAGSLAIACVLSSSPTFAQQISQTSVSPAPTHKSVTIVIGNKFQEVLNASTTALRMLHISTNNTNDDSCWVFVGGGQASKEGSYAVLPGKEYLRYPPFVSSDAIQATCESSSDTLDVEYQWEIALVENLEWRSTFRVLL
jgi:hypothetical protein